MIPYLPEYCYIFINAKEAKAMDKLANVCELILYNDSGRALDVDSLPRITFYVVPTVIQTGQKTEIQLEIVDPRPQGFETAYFYNEPGSQTYGIFTVRNGDQDLVFHFVALLESRCIPKTIRQQILAGCA
jgi:hypothetical protein